MAKNDSGGIGKRVLRFAVSGLLVTATPLLGASSCGGSTQNEPEPHTVNEGPQPEPDSVNEGPQTEPEQPPTQMVNPGPQDEPAAPEAPPQTPTGTH